MTSATPVKEDQEESEQLASAHDSPSPAEPFATIAERHGCDITAVVRLVPYVVDGSLIALAVSAGRHVTCADLILRLNASTVRPVSAEQVCTAFRLGAPPHRTYMDRRLLEREFVVVCVAPPDGYHVMTPAHLQDSLGAEELVL